MFQKEFLLGNTIGESFTITNTMRWMTWGKLRQNLSMKATKDCYLLHIATSICFLKGKVFLLKAENSCHIPRHINCLVIFQQGAQTHQRKMLEDIQNTQFSKHWLSNPSTMSVIDSLMLWRLDWSDSGCWRYQCNTLWNRLLLNLKIAPFLVRNIWYTLVMVLRHHSPRVPNFTDCL